MDNKQQTREELQAAMAKFVANGGKVQNLPAKKVPENRKVTE